MQKETAVPLVIALLCLAIVPWTGNRPVGESVTLQSWRDIQSGRSCLSTPATNPTPAVNPGFTSSYDAVNGVWHWRYAQVMATGCQRLLFRSDPVSVGSNGTVTVELQSYNRDEQCKQPAQLDWVTGSIGGSASTKFQVFVDGELKSS